MFSSRSEYQENTTVEKSVKKKNNNNKNKNTTVKWIKFLELFQSDKSRSNEQNSEQQLLLFWASFSIWLEIPLSY